VAFDDRLRMLLARCLALFRRRREDEMLDDEIELHLTLLEQRFIAQGLAADEARRAARRAFGGVQQLRESHRDGRGFAWLSEMAQDGTYALRLLRRQPTFAAVAILTLAFGIGANTAVFSVIEAVLLRPAPYPSPDRVERVGWRWNDRDPAIGAMAPYKYEYLRDHARVFEHLAVWQVTTRDLGPRGAGGPATVLRVSNEFFPVVGSWPSQGRGFTDEEQQPGTADVVVLSDACWTAQFGRDPSAIGKTLLLDDRPHTIVGVMAAGFAFPEAASPAAAIVPLALDADPRDMGANYSVMGRVRSGLTRAAIQMDLDRVFAQLRQERPEQLAAREGAVLMTFEEIHLASVARPLWTLFAGVIVVLFIACTNVGNLLLVRGTTRVPELAIRVAIGASRARIVRQGITEGLVLAAIGGAAGVALGAIGVRAFLTLVPADVARIDQVRLDGTVLMFTIVIVVVAGVLFGLASTRVGAHRRAGPVSLAVRGTAVTAAGRHLRQWLVGVECGLAMLLLVVAVLLSSAFHQLARTDLGFDPNGLVAISFRRVPPAFRNAERSAATEHALLERLAAIPGVKAAAATSVAPLGERGWNIPMTVVGRPDLTEGAVEWRTVSRGYAGAVGLRLRVGRWFTDEDVTTNRPVTVVNASLAARYWPGSNPIGQQIWLGVFRGEVRPGSRPTALEIIGVVEDVRELGPTRPARRTVFVPRTGTTAGMPIFLVRAAGVAPDVLRSAVRETDAALPEPIASTFESRLDSRLSRDRFASRLAQVFAATALLMTAIGVYGVVSWVVRHATREIGIRMALGAGRFQVLRDVLVRGLSPVFAGLLVGAIASVAASNVFAGLVVGAARVSAGVITVAAALLMAAAAISVWIPARRAMTVDPAATLRTE
jgi:putative ABC transport system permease protein